MAHLKHKGKQKLICQSILTHKYASTYDTRHPWASNKTGDVGWEVRQVGAGGSVTHREVGERQAGRSAVARRLKTARPPAIL